MHEGKIFCFYICLFHISTLDDTLDGLEKQSRQIYT